MNLKKYKVKSFSSEDLWNDSKKHVIYKVKKESKEFEKVLSEGF